MSREFWAIIGVGVSIATLIVGLGALMVTAHAGINARLDAMQAELTDIGQRVAYIEGRLDIQLPEDERQ